ncbi:UDP-N-acetylmuramoyl-L-alanyl-D-glutamate--2,6-diaminopimelate ligase [Georgenia faecalis]|uniref:UDP-N-acetylmuramyl-tripeptide synthetase n=2 Tax=Georgenia faecalis TaxID=2483799 RepID=A0ABV9DF18_9MICO|nr:UDP-N-acetylmuramoyl-L-alanyl-D-glutamate--2,6-diaminopimelate ligase [Georgenia faecalis]
MTPDLLRPRMTRPTPLAALARHLGMTPLTGVDPAGVDVVGASVASDDVGPGEVFIALPGARTHGATYVPQALDAGAVAVVTDTAGAELCARVCLDRGVPLLVTEDPRALAGPLSALVYGLPAEHLRTAAVTGTNGKTTTTYFLDAIARRATAATAVLGTVELRVGETTVPSPRTTVEAPVLHRLLALGLERGVGAASIEVSSHALALHRVDGLVVDVAGFTNLQRDHLDYHGTMERYLADKAILFTPEHARRAVVCVDDEWGRALAARTVLPVDRVRAYPGDAEAEWTVHDASIGLDGVASTFTLRGPGGFEVQASCPLPGRVNIQNAALAIVMGLRWGVAPADVVDAVAHAHGIPGRMERVSQRGDGLPLTVVDFAHTPDALELALEAVRPVTPGRLIAVFGSDGDRDQGKRPLLGAVAARLADVLVVTDENPRSEDPATIRRAILDGVRSVRPDLTDVDEASTRVEAIARAVEIAGPEDTIIITGKGHEPHQEIAGVFHPYNDVPVLREAIERRWGTR